MGDPMIMLLERLIQTIVSNKTIARKMSHEYVTLCLDQEFQNFKEFEMSRIWLLWF